MRLRPSGTAAGEQAQSKADLFKYCQPGATQASFHPHGAGLTSMNQAGLRTTPSAFLRAGAGGLATVKFANPLALRCRSATLIPGAFGFGLALHAADATTGGRQSYVLGHLLALCLGGLADARNFLSEGLYGPGGADSPVDIHDRLRPSWRYIGGYSAYDVGNARTRSASRLAS